MKKTLHQKTIRENNKYRQGRSKEQVRASYMGACISISGVVLLVILYFIFG